jgi:hypothetical protein
MIVSRKENHRQKRSGQGHLAPSPSRSRWTRDVLTTAYEGQMTLKGALHVVERLSDTA